ncbi:MAG: MucR family transcriptional regulator [Hellea sp.]|nr:MucR family transcriptional regulator [Hellea sp.]
MTELDRTDILYIAADIVTAYVGRNDIPAKDIPQLLNSVFDSVQALANPDIETGEDRVPAVAVEDSVTDEVIYSLEDGQPYKSLKRHLRSKYNMTPEDYRARWGLSPDYPMVSPAYARERSRLAKKSGLGKS